MRRSGAFLFFGLLLCFIFSAGIQAQTSSSSTQFDMTGFPMWAKDLRRGEIVAFGSFPFAYFFATFGFDTYRFFNHGYDMRYAPWPFTSAAAIEQTQNEKFLTVGIAAGGAIVIALVDYIIVRVKRSRERAETGNLPDGTPIINRRPLYGDDGDEAGTSGGGD